MIAKDEGLSNFLPINRKFFTHLLWKEERTYSKAEAWLDLLQQARFEASEGKMLMGNKMVTWNRGQLIASLRYLANRWLWSTKKVTGFIELLQSERMITKVTQKETGQSLITICNYDSYNGQEKKKKQEGNTEETARKREGNKTNIDKEGKEVLGANASPTIQKTELEIRQSAFKDELRSHVETYGKEMITAFYDYWREPNKSKSKMKFETNQTWDLKLRLKTWEANQIRFKQTPKRKEDLVKEAEQKLAEQLGF